MLNLLMDWLAPAMLGALIGVVMAFYQLTLEATMTAVWGQKPITDGVEPHRLT